MRLRVTTGVLALLTILTTVIVCTTTADASPTGAARPGAAESHNTRPGTAVRPQASQPQYSYANAIRETVWVDNGHGARVAADIIRPREMAEQGQKAPVIMDASPYYSCCGRGNESQLKTYDQQGRPVGFPLYYDNYFVPRGYAVVLVDLAGTNRSTGCVDIGGPSDVDSAKSVIDWLNKRGKGYSSASGGDPVTEDWATGDVGMIGKSYDGTIANGVAATGVDGLKTIVPISAISSWYDYYRSDGVAFTSGTPAQLARAVEQRNGGQDCGAENGTLAQGATPNGDVNAFWTARNYAGAAKNVKASVFAAQGLGDLNVKTVNFGQWWDGLAANNVQRKVWLSQTGHVDPFDYRRQDWVDTLHSWFDHYLLGVDNGVDKGPMASIERHPDTWTDEAVWPARGSTPTTLNPKAGNTNGLGSLAAAAGTPGNESFTDDPSQDETAWAGKPDQSAGDRTLFTTGALREDLRISGTGSVTVTATPSTSGAHLSAMLVDYGPASIRDYTGQGEGITTLDTQSCWGDSASGDSACYRDTKSDTKNVDMEIFSRGWADLANYASLSQEKPLTPGTPYTMTFRLATTDHVVPKGHQLALIIGGTDSAFITAPDHPGQLALDLAKTSVTLPVSGGAPALPVHLGRLPIVRPDHLLTLPTTKPTRP